MVFLAKTVWGNGCWNPKVQNHTATHTHTHRAKKCEASVRRGGQRSGQTKGIGKNTTATMIGSSLLVSWPSLSCHSPLTCGRRVCDCLFFHVRCGMLRRTLPHRSDFHRLSFLPVAGCLFCLLRVDICNCPFLFPFPFHSLPCPFPFLFLSCPFLVSYLSFSCPFLSFSSACPSFGLLLNAAAA